MELEGIERWVRFKGYLYFGNGYRFFVVVMRSYLRINRNGLRLDSYFDGYV